MEISQSQTLLQITQSNIASLTQASSATAAEQFAASTQNSPPTHDTGIASQISDAFSSLVNPASLINAQLLAQQVGEQPTEETLETAEKSASDLFLEYAELSPEQRERQRILKQLGLTEEELEQLPPEERKAVEEKIAEITKANAERIAEQSVEKTSAEQA